MISRVYDFKINMDDTENPVIPMPGKSIEDRVYIQGDTGVNGMNIQLVTGEEENEQAIDLTGCLVTVTAQRSDGHLTEKMLVKEDAVNGDVAWEMDKTDLSVPGIVTVSVQLYDGFDGRISSGNFDYEVVASLTADEELISSTQYDLYVNARHCGSYRNTTRYFMNNIVEYAGASYMALRDTQGETPPAPPALSNDCWCLLSQRGSTGWKGSYEGSTAYGVGDIVQHGGSSWICVQKCAESEGNESGEAPPQLPYTKNDFWNLLAREGAVSSVNEQTPDEAGAVTLTPEDIGVDLAGRMYLYQNIGGAL